MELRSCFVMAILAVGCSSDALVSGPAPEAETGTPPAATGVPTSPVPTTTGVPTGAPPVGTAPSDRFEPLPDYPAGPYGRGVGAVMDDIEFLGWRFPAGSAYDPAALERVRLSDFYDPSGTTTKLLVINSSAVWCTVCQAEMRQIKREDLYRQYRERGVEFLGTLFEDANGGPARPSDLKLWGSAAVRAIEFPLVLDPSLRLGIYYTSDATPLNLLIDAQTMRIIHVAMGYDGTESGLWSIVDGELERRGVTPP